MDSEYSTGQSKKKSLISATLQACSTPTQRVHEDTNNTINLDTAPNQAARIIIKKKKWIRPLPTNVQYATQPMCWETTNWIRQKLIQTLIQTLRRPLLCVVLHLVLHRPPSVWRLEAPYIPPPTLPMLYELYAFLATHPCHPHFPDHHLPHLAKVPHRQIIT